MAVRPGTDNKLLEITIDVHIMKKNNEIRQEKEDIMRTITAISNYQRRGVIRMKNLQRKGRTFKRSGLCENVTAKHLDQWKTIIVQEALKLIPDDWSIFEFSSQSQDTEYLLCHVTPSIRPITLEYKLHVSAAVDVTRVVRNFDEALAILIRNERSESKTQPIVSQQLDFELSHAHSSSTDPLSLSSTDPLSLDLKTTANTQLQIFKKNISINRDKGKSGDASLEREEITKTIENVVSNLIGAVANSSGGVIIVIDDSNILEVVDGIVSKNDQDLVIQCLEECINNKIWGRVNVSPTRGENWDVQFPIVDGQKIVFTVRVLAFFGGVFEGEPVAFTLVEDTPGAFKVTRMNFEDWYKAMMKRHLESEETKQEAAAKLRNIEERSSNNVCGSREMTPYTLLM